MDLKESKKVIGELTKRNQNLEKENISLEMEVKASRKIIHKLKKDNELMEEYEEAIIDKDDLIKKFEKGKTISDKVIQNLKKEINVQGNEMCNVKKITEEKETLEKDILENKDVIENLQKEIALLKANEDVLKRKVLKNDKGRKQLHEWIKHLEELGNKRRKDIEMMEKSLKKKFTASKKPRCRFGWDCQRRAFCRFDHSYLYLKDNTTKTQKTVQPADPITPLCDICGQTFTNQKDFESHVVEYHGTSKIPSQDENGDHVTRMQEKKRNRIKIK